MLDRTVLFHARRTFYAPCWETIDGEDMDKEPEVISDGFRRVVDLENPF